MKEITNHKFTDVTVNYIKLKRNTMKRIQLKESDLRKIIKRIIKEQSSSGTMINYARSCTGSLTIGTRCWQNPTGNPIQVGDVLKVTGGLSSANGRSFFAKDTGGPCNGIDVYTTVGTTCPKCCSSTWSGAGNQTPSGACVANCGGPPPPPPPPPGVDCTQYGVDYNPTTLVNAGSFFTGGINAANNGNCNAILNKIQQVNNISNQDKKDCRLDYLDDLLAACQGNSGVQVSQTFINTMTNRYNNKGCYGVGGSPTNILNNSICDKKADFCPGSTPMKQAKCNWLTTFTANNNCNC